MTTTQDPIAHASRLLREAAEELRQAHAYNNSEGWENETDAKAAYDEHMAAAQALEDWEAAVGAGGVQPLRSVQEGCKLVPLEPTQEMLAALMSPGEAEVLASSPSETFALMLMDRAGIRERYSAMLAASPTPPAEQQAPSAAAADTVALQAALRAIHQAIDLIGEPDTERLRTVRRVLRGAVIVAEDAGEAATAPQPAPAELERLRERISKMGLDVDRAMRGHVNEQSPLGTTRLAAIAALAKPAPAPLSDDTERLNWLLWKLPGNALRYVVGELADTSSGAEFRAAIDAARKQGVNHD